MGDHPPRSRPPGDFSTTVHSTGANDPRFSTTGIYESNDPGRVNYGTSQAGQSFQSQLHQQEANQLRPEPFGMNSLVAALPDLSYQNYNQQPSPRYTITSSAPALFYPDQNIPQFVGQTSMNIPTNPSYNMAYQAQYQGMFASSHSVSSQHLQPGSTNTNQFYQNPTFMGQQQQQQLGSPYFISSGQYSPQSQPYPGSPSALPYVASNSFQGESRMTSQQRSNEYLAPPGRSNGISKPNHGNSIIYLSLSLNLSQIVANPSSFSVQYWPVFRRQRPSSKTSSEW